MRVLVTNDDGIDSPGLHALAVRSSEIGLLPIVAAPSVNLSGASSSLVPLGNPKRVQIEERELDGFTDSPGYSVAAPPALIVMLAMIGGFGDPPELVLAGVNVGPNTGRSTLFSGTIGAVMTGARFGRSGLATSLDIGPSEETTTAWSTATDFAAPVIRWLMTAPRPTMLNLNVPNLPSNEIRGLRQADLAPVGRVQTVITGRDAVGLDIDLIPTNDEAPVGTDSALVGDGYATVTSLDLMGPRTDHLPIAKWTNEIGVPG